MKKFSILLMGALALGFAACDDAPVEPPVQSNPQPPMYEDSQVSSSKAGVLAQSTAFDLNDYQTAEAGVPVMSVTTSEAFPAGATVSGVMQLASEPSFGSPQEVSVTVTDGTGYASATEWNNAHVTLFGRARQERTMYYRIAGYVNVDGGIYRIGDDNTYLVSGEVKELCFDLGVAISEAYYFLSGSTTWSLQTADALPYLMYHSPADPMDDPVFRFYVSVDGEQWWKIAPHEAMNQAEEAWGLVLGPNENGNTNAKGQLVEGSQSDNAAACIKGQGTYCVEFDAIGMTYNVYKVADMPYLFTPGGSNGWSMYASQWLAWHEGSKSFKGLVKADAGDGFKMVSIVNGVNWSNPNWGGSAGVLTADGANIKPDHTAIYFVSADTEALTYELTEITHISLIGAFNNWGGDLDLTPSNDMLIWSAQGVQLGGEFKVRMNHDWAISYGGAMPGVTFNDGNLSVEEGVYNVTFDLSGNLPYLTVSK